MGDFYSRYLHFVYGTAMAPYLLLNTFSVKCLVTVGGTAPSLYQVRVIYHSFSFVLPSFVIMNFRIFMVFLVLNFRIFMVFSVLNFRIFKEVIIFAMSYIMKYK